MLCDTTDFLSDPIPSKVKAGIADIDMILVLCFCFLAMFNGVRKIKKISLFKLHNYTKMQTILSYLNLKGFCETTKNV